ncbi:MAG: molybdenum cofactor guanylyltransferase [Pseudomonas sp.]
MTGSSSSTWTGVLLAGGRSSRMGRDKATLDWHGTPLIEHMRGLLESAGAARVAVSGDYPAYAGIEDLEPGLGPLGGLLSVATVLPDGELLVVPVDMPLLTPACLHRLLAARARCVAFEDHVLPMRLRLDSDSREVLRRLAAAPQAMRSLRALQRALDATWLPLPPGSAAGFDNCNTPEQWRAIRA